MTLTLSDGRTLGFKAVSGHGMFSFSYPHYICSIYFVFEEYLAQYLAQYLALQIYLFDKLGLGLLKCTFWCKNLF